MHFQRQHLSFMRYRLTSSSSSSYHHHHYDYLGGGRRRQGRGHRCNANRRRLGGRGGAVTNAQQNNTRVDRTVTARCSLLTFAHAVNYSRSTSHTRTPQSFHVNRSDNIHGRLIVHPGLPAFLTMPPAASSLESDRQCLIDSCCRRRR